MTTYKIKDRTVTLDRAAVVSQMIDSENRAAVCFRGGSSTEREFFTSAEIRGLGERYRADAQRLRKVVETIDAGIEELPAHLYPR